jgi:HEAT repeat protein
MRTVRLQGLVIAAALAAGLPDARCGDHLPGIVFVSDVIFGPKYEAEGVSRPGTSHWRDGYIYHRATTQHPLERTTTPTRPGRNLYTLVPAAPDGTLARITHLDDGEVFDPEPSYDGSKILFSMRRDGEDWFNLYEIGADGTRLAQLTDGPFNDVSGVYLPDGRIVFISDRAGYLEEYHEERTETLWTMNADGTGIKQLTFNPGTVFDPTVLSDGRILFSLWDTFMLNIPPADKHETYLMTIRPDGTEEGHFFGARQHRFFNRERHSGVSFNQAGQMPDGTILVQTEMGPSILDPSRGPRAEDALWPVFPCTTSIQLGGATHRVHLSPTGSRSTPYPLPDGRFLFSATLPGARDIGVYLCDPKTREVELVFNDPETSEFDPRPIYWQRPRPIALAGKGRFAGGPASSPGRPRVADRPGTGVRSVGSPAASFGGPKGSRIPVTGRARFVVVNARRSDNPSHEQVLHRARYFRVVEALHTAVTSSSHTSLATRILGVVPILPDGSAYFEVPADTPLFLEPLDAAGRRMLFDWQLPETSVPVGSKQVLTEMTYVTVGPGEMKSCNGCHAAQHESPDPAGVAAATDRRPVRLERDLTDALYRRNEPDEYRCHARIGEAPRYIPWLASPDSDVRRRGCEMLMAIEDGSGAAEPAIQGLLQDESITVRRAAALALTAMGTTDSVAELLQAFRDSDWQVRFHAASALEAITAYAPGREADEEAIRQFYEQLFVGQGTLGKLKTTLGLGPDALRRLGQDDPDLLERWFEAAGRLGAVAPETARVVVREALNVPLPPPIHFEPWAGKRHDLEGQPPKLGAIRAAGRMKDAQSVSLLVPWLARHEYWDHATESAVALGRIGTPEAVEALWEALRRDVPDLKPFLNRYVQRGPRPEEYALLRGLILAEAAPQLDDVSLVIAMLPGTFLEKPRYEDRLRPESQRVLIGRLLLENAGLRSPVVRLLVDVLRGVQPTAEGKLYQEILEGINLERPFAEHRRPFPVVSQIEPEQALWLLGCLAIDRSEVPESLVVPYLGSENWRERIDSAVLLNQLGFGTVAAEVLASEAGKPYAFNEIMGIGKSHFDTNFRDKCYMVMALAHHTDDVARLATFADPLARYRDVRYGLAVGLGFRGTPDGIDLLNRLATEDPISAVRRQARESLRAIQEEQRLAGQPVPRVDMPAELPFEAWHPPRGLAWSEPLVVTRLAANGPMPESLEALKGMISEGLQAEHYRDLNNSNNQAPGATRMMISGVDPLSSAVAALSQHYPDSSEPVIRTLVESPYPFAQYLGLRELAKGECPNMDDALVQTLDKPANSADTVGFYWTCEALAARRVDRAIPALVRFTTEEAPAAIHGPAGMGLGYPAAKAVARLAGQIAHPEVQRLLHHENHWIRAGALAGLVESRAPGIDDLLRELREERQTGLVRDQAAVGLSLDKRKARRDNVKMSANLLYGTGAE